MIAWGLVLVGIAVLIHTYQIKHLYLTKKDK